MSKGSRSAYSRHKTEFRQVEEAHGSFARPSQTSHQELHIPAFDSATRSRQAEHISRKKPANGSCRPILNLPVPSSVSPFGFLGRLQLATIEAAPSSAPLFGFVGQFRLTTKSRPVDGSMALPFIAVANLGDEQLALCRKHSRKRKLLRACQPIMRQSVLMALLSEVS